MLKMIGAPKLVEIRRIHVDGSAPVDMEKENVKEIAKSIQETGGVVLQPSLVDKKTGKIVCGRDRILAQMRFRKCAWVQYVTGTELDLAMAAVDENLCRRHDGKGELRAKRVALTQEVITVSKPPTKEPEEEPKRGRPNTGKTAAIAAVAKEEGVSPSAVRRSISRAKKKAAAEPEPEADEPETREPQVSAPKVSCLRTLGLEVPEVVEDAARAEQKRVDRMAGALREFGAALTDHRKEMAGLDAFDDKKFQEWEEQRSSMAAAIRRSRPACVCPHCKPHTHDGKTFIELTQTCLACRGLGYISEEKLEGVEKCLLAEGDDSGIWVPSPGKRPQWRTMISVRGEDF
ncbi:MAG TPA: hypothetical protein VJ860_18445 [Polyangia bacterium]|jgi:hypothetical protein|nr:hypothetical protein [Polyangia bacterium]